MTITKKDIEKALSILDPDAKDMFLAMSDEERDTILLSMSGSNSNRLANVEKWQIDYERNNRLYREKREKREDNNSDDVMNTTQKILKAIAESEAKKFNLAVWMRDRVAPGLVQGAIMAVIIVMGLIAAGKFP